MTTTLTNGARPAAPSWPATPLLLAPVPLPFAGSYEGVTVWYDIDAVQRLPAERDALTADLSAAFAALDLSDPAALPVAEDLALEIAMRVIGACVARITTPYAGLVLAPADVLEAWHPQVVTWCAYGGVEAARGWMRSDFFGTRSSPTM